MKLSVVMAVRNGCPHVSEAIESVLAQSIGDFEFLIVDDASTDDTPSVLSGYQSRDARVRVLRNATQQGPYPSANRAFAEARGDAIARHDADDVSPPERFAIQLEALASSSDVSLVTGIVEWFGDGCGPVRVSAPPAWQPRLEWELLFTNAVGSGGHVMFPRIVGGTRVQFPAKRAFAEDYGLWYRLSQLGRVVCPQHTIYRYRRHAGSITARHGAEQADCLSQIRCEIQSPYLPSGVAHETITALARFWNEEGHLPLCAGMRAIHDSLSDLRQNFLRYVERRYGPADRAALAAELDAAYRDRLEYWLFRSIRRFDPAVFSDVLFVARANHEVVTVCAGALSRVARSIARKAR